MKKRFYLTEDLSDKKRRSSLHCHVSSIIRKNGDFIVHNKMHKSGVYLKSH
ncbi:MAG: hypothetical protein ACFNKL_06515 [Treponema sp.]